MNNILYHYTNFKVLESILKYDTVKNKEICFWASRYDCFKDGEEFKYGLEWIKSALLDHESNLGRPKEDQIADLFEPSTVLSNPSLPKPFVVSLTCRPDDEYMWQSYTKGQDEGIVLELNLNDEVGNIATVNNKQFFLSFYNCLYDLPEHKDWNLINFQYWYFVYAGNIGNSVPGFFRLFHALALLMFFCPRIKQADYKKENETRLILGVPDLEWCNIFTAKSNESGLSKDQIIEGLKKFSGNKMENVHSKDIEQYVSNIHQNAINNKWYKELFLPKIALKGIYVKDERLIDEVKELLVTKNFNNVPINLVTNYQ